MNEPVEFIPGGVFPRDGTRDGARAAWAFIVSHWGTGAGLTDTIDEHYRRELEAM